MSRNSDERRTTTRSRGLNWTKSLMACVGFTLAGVNTVLAVTPSFTPLGDLPGGSFQSWAGGVSADGTIVAGSSASNSDLYQSEAFVWRDGSMSGLGFPASTDPHPFSSIQAVSGDGSILAGSASSNEGTNEPFRWENGVFTRLGRIPGYGTNAHFVTGISSNGQRIVGWGFDEVHRWNQAWLWDNGTMIGLGALSGPTSAAFGISGDGNVVVGDGNGQAFRWTDGTMYGLGFLPSPFPGLNVGLTSVASSASYDGTVIVGGSAAFDEDTEQYQREAFRWSDGVMSGLGDLPGGDFHSFAKAVSADGSVIVGHGTTSAGQLPFIWDSQHGMRPLQDVLVSDLGLDLTGWTLQYVSGLSADGSVIVGTGINPDGNHEAFRAVVPEPTTFSLVALGAAAVAAHRRVRTHSRIGPG